MPSLQRVATVGPTKAPVNWTSIRERTEGLMANLEDLSRVICRHEWPNVECWVECLCSLADLSDEEICELDRRARSEASAAAA